MKVGREDSILNRPITFRRKPKESRPQQEEPLPPADADLRQRRVLARRSAVGVDAELGWPPTTTPAPPAPEAATEETPLPAPSPAAAARSVFDESTLPELRRTQRPRRAAIPPLRSQRVGRRRKSLVGLKIGASGISAAQVVNGDAPRVVRIAREPLPAGVVLTGEARRPDDLALALKAFFRKHKLPRGPVRLGIANNRIGVRVLELTGIEDPKQLGNAVRFRAQDVLPIPLEEAVLDYRVLREETDAEGNAVHRVLLVVAHRQLVEGFVWACRSAGLKLVGIDLEAFGLLRALADPAARVGAGDDAALVVVSIGHDLSTLAVSDGSVCDFTRVLEWGGAALDAAVGRALGVTPGDAELIREEAGLTNGRPLANWLPAHDAARAREAMRAELQSFARDLVASLRFYQEQPDSLGIPEIVLAGGCAHLHGIDTELTSLMGVSARVGDPLTRARIGRKLSREHPSAALTAAIGLGIED